jgi:hypothetical protein
MKRLSSLLAASALVLSLAAGAVAQEAKDAKEPPAKDNKAQPAKEGKSDKAAPAKDDKSAPPAKESSDKGAAPKAQPAEVPKETPYYPLQVGNTWNYKLGDNRYLLRVAKYEKVGDYNCARVEMVVEDKVASHEHLTVTNEGLVRVAYDDKRADPPLLFLKLPPAKDATWKVDSVIGKTDQAPGERVTGTFTQGEEAKVKVPAGTFEGVVTCASQNLDANGLKLSFKYFFAKGTGMIKQEIDVGGQKVIIELEKFEPAKQ